MLCACMHILVSTCKYRQWKGECVEWHYTKLMSCVQISGHLASINCKVKFCRRIILPLTSYPGVCSGSLLSNAATLHLLNHLAQAARAVLQNASQIGQMLTDLNRVDFGNVQVSRVSWKPACPLILHLSSLKFRKF